MRLVQWGECDIKARVKTCPFRFQSVSLSAVVSPERSVNSHLLLRRSLKVTCMLTFRLCARVKPHSEVSVMCVHIGLSIFFYTLKSLFWVAAHEATTWTRGDQPQVPRSRVSANQCTERYRSRYFCRNQRLAITMLRAIGPKWTIYQTKFGYKEVQLKNVMIQDHFTAKALPPKVLNVLTYLHCKPEYLQTMSDCPTGLRCSRLG